MTERYEIRLAEARDLEDIHGLIGEAAGWLEGTKNTDQWTRPWPTREARNARMAGSAGILKKERPTGGMRAGRPATQDKTYLGLRAPRHKRNDLA